MRTLTTYATALALAATVATAAVAQNHPNPGSQQARIEQALQQPTTLGGATVDPKYTILDAIKHSNLHTSLTNAVATTKLAHLLYGPGPYTIFAPTNHAFSQLNPDTLASLQNNHRDLRGVLTYHVVPGRLNSVDLVRAIERGKGEATITTLNSRHLRATMGPNNVILLWDQFGNNAEITQANVVGSNGIVHVIDKVMLPATR